MEFKIQLKVKDLLHKRRMTQSQLSDMSGVPAATLSDIINDKRTSVNKEHLASIAKALDVTDIRELIEFVDNRKENE